MDIEATVRTDFDCKNRFCLPMNLFKSTNKVYFGKRSQNFIIPVMEFKE